MLNASPISIGLLVRANVGLTAFRVAAVQAKVFEKTLEEVTDRQEQVVNEQARKSKALRQKVSQQAAEAQGGVDVVVERSESAPANDPAPVANANAQGNKVDLEV
ncbi:MAG: hypothetical protein IH994_08120 [Proteobacteria bacterium]|nr:hypothetical protein [Pseudomonadota bacterium]